MTCYKRLKSLSINGALINQIGAESFVMVTEVDGESVQPTVSQHIIAFIKKSVSSLVMISYLSLTVGQSYAMDGKKVAHFDESEGIEFKASYSTPAKFSKNTVVPVEIGTPTSVTRLLDQQCLEDLENGLGGNFANKAGGLPTDIVDDHLLSQNVNSSTELKQEEKEDEIRRAQGLFGNAQHKVHPFQVEQIDVESGLLKKPEDHVEEKDDDDHQSVNSDHSEDSPEAIAKRDKILKGYEARVKDVFKQEMSYLDWALIIAPLVCTGLIAQNEILGEYRLFIGSVLDTFALNPMWYAKLYLEYNNKKGQDLFREMMKWNAYVSLPFYLMDRVSSFFSYFEQSYKNISFRTKIGYSATTVGLLGVIIAAVNAGAYPAISQYAFDIDFPATKEYAQTLPPYLFGFYTIDAFLINSFWKDKAYKYLFVDRKDDATTKPIRQLLLKKLRTTKAVIASMSNDEVFNLDHLMTEKLAASTSEYPSINAVKALNKIASEDQNQNRRYSVKARNNATKKHFSLVSFAKNNSSYLVGLGLAVGGAYLGLKGSQNKFANLMHTEVSMENALPSFDFHKMGVEYSQQLSLSGYHAWLEATENLEVFNGNHTDWCWQCLQSAVFSTGSIEEGGTFVFRDCPGVSYVSAIDANSGDLGYTHDQCVGAFNYFDSTYAYWAGISNDDYYYTPPLDPLTLTPTQQKLAFAGALLYAAVNAIAAAPATKEVVKRVSDSFSNQPEEILPGKRHKLLNAGTLLTAGAEAFVRTAFAAAASWYVLQSTDMSQSLLWSIVGLTWVSTMMNYIIPLDDAYSKIPVRVGKSVQLTKNLVSKVVVNVSENSYVNFIRGYLPDASSYTSMFKSSSVTPEPIQEDLDQSTKEKSPYATPLVNRVKENVAAIPQLIKTKADELQQNLSAAIICDDYIERINQLIGTLETAQEDVIHAVHQEMMS